MLEGLHLLPQHLVIYLGWTGGRTEMLLQSAK